MLDLDGTPNKGKLGANAILGVSLAVGARGRGAVELPLYRYLGGVRRRLLPVPMMNILNGGAHANWQGTDLQEFMIAPGGRAQFPRGAALGQRDLPRAQERAQGARASTGVGDEGGFAPALKTQRGSRSR